MCNKNTEYIIIWRQDVYKIGNSLTVCGKFPNLNNYRCGCIGLLLMNTERQASLQEAYWGDWMMLYS